MLRAKVKSFRCLAFEAVSNLCEFCENHWKKISQLFIDEVFIVQPAKYTRMGDSEEFPVPLNFCPACGEKLEEVCHA